MYKITKFKALFSHFEGIHKNDITNIKPLSLLELFLHKRALGAFHKVSIFLHLTKTCCTVFETS